MSKEITEIEAYQKLQENFESDIESSQIVIREGEIELKFRFQKFFGGETIIMSAIWNTDLNKFYFEFKDFLKTQENSLLTKKEFVREMGELLEEPSFSLC